MAKLAQRLRMGYGEAAGQYLNSGILSPKHTGEAFWWRLTSCAFP